MSNLKERYAKLNKKQKRLYAELIELMDEAFTALMYHERTKRISNLKRAAIMVEKRKELGSSVTEMNAKLDIHCAEEEVIENEAYIQKMNTQHQVEMKKKEIASALQEIRYIAIMLNHNPENDDEAED